MYIHVPFTCMYSIHVQCIWSWPVMEENGICNVMKGNKK